MTHFSRINAMVHQEAQTALKALESVLIQ